MANVIAAIVMRALVIVPPAGRTVAATTLRP